jgi:hypothetical protein
MLGVRAGAAWQPQARKPVGVNVALRHFTGHDFTRDSRNLRAASTAG